MSDTQNPITTVLNDDGTATVSFTSSKAGVMSVFACSIGDNNDVCYKVGPSGAVHKTGENAWVSIPCPGSTSCTFWGIHDTVACGNMPTSGGGPNSPDADASITFSGTQNQNVRIYLSITGVASFQVAQDSPNPGYATITQGAVPGDLMCSYDPGNATIQYSTDGGNSWAPIRIQEKGQFVALPNPSPGGTLQLRAQYSGGVTSIHAVATLVHNNPDQNDYDIKFEFPGTDFSITMEVKELNFGESRIES